MTRNYCAWSAQTYYSFCLYDGEPAEPFVDVLTAGFKLGRKKVLETGGTVDFEAGGADKTTLCTFSTFYRSIPDMLQLGNQASAFIWFSGSSARSQDNHADVGCDAE